MRATATFPDGRSLIWEDGQVSGHLRLLDDLKQAAIRYPRAGLTPTGPFYESASYESDVIAFVALVGEYVRSGPKPGWPKFKTEGRLPWPPQDETPPYGCAGCGLALDPKSEVVECPRCGSNVRFIRCD